MEMLKLMAHVDLTHITYKGSAPALTDLIGGQVQVMFDNLPNALPHVKAGKLRALAVSTAQRAALMPELPTLAEAGVPGYEVEVWFGVVAPAGTPKDVVAKLNGEINRILALPDVKSRFAEQGVRVIGGPAGAPRCTPARADADLGEGGQGRGPAHGLTRDACRHPARRCLPGPRASRAPGDSALSKVILVTGGRTGLGEAVCRHMAERGWSVAVADINGDGARAVAAACVRDGGSAFPVIVDLASAEGPARMVEETVRQAGRIDVLVNCAAAAPAESFLEMTAAAWETALAVNVRAVALAMAAARARWRSKAAAASSTSPRPQHAWRCPTMRPTRRPRPPSTR